MWCKYILARRREKFINCLDDLEYRLLVTGGYSVFDGWKSLLKVINRNCSRRDRRTVLDRVWSNSKLNWLIRKNRAFVALPRNLRIKHPDRMINECEQLRRRYRLRIWSIKNKRRVSRSINARASHFHLDRSPLPVSISSSIKITTIYAADYLPCFSHSCSAVDRIHRSIDTCPGSLRQSRMQKR